MKEIEIPFLDKVTIRDKAFLARQLATMIDSGLSIDKALSVFIGQTKNVRLKRVLTLILGDIEGGLSFSDALKKHRDVFDEVYINIVVSGEAVGKLADVLRKLAITLEKQDQFMSQVKSAFYYPGFVLCVLVIIVFIMITQVIPPLKEIFDEFSSELPWTTRNLMLLSEFMARYWWGFLIFAILSVVVLYFYLKTDNGKYTLSRIQIRLPLDIGKDVYMARFAQTLSMLLSSGTPIIKALTITSEVMNNVIYEAIIKNASDQMERGIPLSVPIEKQIEFNPLVPQMIRVGEETGKMDQTLDNLAKYFENEANTKIKNINSLIEPVLIVIIGLGVAFIVFAIIMPIYQLVQLQ
jgi:type II secretory pathway component PulF